MTLDTLLTGTVVSAGLVTICLIIIYSSRSFVAACIDVLRAVVALLQAAEQYFAAVEPVELPTFPDNVEEWIKQESEVWAQEGLRARAAELYELTNNWEQVLYLMQKDVDNAE